MQKRTTLYADLDDLDAIEREAKRRGVTLTHVLREMVAEYATGIREQQPKPRFGVAEGPADLSQRSVEDEEAPARRDAWR
ncbi:MAG: CopG family transcriptional regulator [Dehalococcoidia bacterium]